MDVAIGADNQSQLVVIVALFQHILPLLQLLQSLVLPITAPDNTHIERSAHEDDTLAVLVHHLSDVVVTQLRIIARTQRNLNLYSITPL